MKHLLKLPFIFLWVVITYMIYSEFGVVQVVEPYLIDVNHLVGYSITVSFCLYGLYAAFRDVIILLIRQRMIDQIKISKHRIT